MYFATMDGLTMIPSFRGSPWMPGRPTEDSRQTYFESALGRREGPMVARSDDDSSSSRMIGRRGDAK